jgi:hypothetical protein
MVFAYGVVGGRRILSPDGRSQMGGDDLIMFKSEKKSEVAVHPR